LVIAADAPIIKGNKSRGSFILRAFNPKNMSLQKGNHKNSTRKSPESIIGKYFLFFIIPHFLLNLPSNRKLNIIPIKEMLMGTFPKLIAAARQEIKNIYAFL
jgi:hypothetical protein